MLCPPIEQVLNHPGAFKADSAQQDIRLDNAIQGWRDRVSLAGEFSGHAMGQQRFIAVTGPRRPLAVRSSWRPQPNCSPHIPGMFAVMSKVHGDPLVGRALGTPREGKDVCQLGLARCFQRL